jgi:ATP-dependent Clp protease adaptor protein ClpS
MNRILNHSFPFQHQEDVAVMEEEVQTSDMNALIVFNDDVNTFEHVTQVLMAVCEHSAEQAEQCTLLIHYKGKCTVKVGSFNALKPMRQGLCDKGISAEIQ